MADVIFIVVTVLFFIVACALCQRLRSSVRGTYGTRIYYWPSRVGLLILGVSALCASLAGKVLTLAARVDRNFAAMRRLL